MPNFHLIDLVSQREAVRQQLKDLPVDDIVKWIAARGEVLTTIADGRVVFEAK